MERFQEFFSDEPPNGSTYPVVPDDFDWAAATREERARARSRLVHYRQHVFSTGEIDDL